MKDSLDFKVDWTDVAADPTAARIRIDVAGQNACRAENRWSKTIDDAPHLSAMPLALWLASSWWRLRWEGDPKSNQRSASWRMAHEVSAAGEGFIWPRLAFVSDGNSVRAECLASSDRSIEVLRYIAQFEVSISAAAFERGVDDFIRLVLERGGDQASGLQEVWNEVLAERSDRDMAQYRRLEALLGFDPDEASSDLIQSILNLGSTVGDAAVEEVAAFCNSSAPAPDFKEVLSLSKSDGFLSGRVAHDVLAEPINEVSFDTARKSAKDVRKAKGMKSYGPVSDKSLADLLGLSEVQLVSGQKDQGGRYPIGLTVADHGSGEADRIFFRQKNLQARRFEASRMFFDEITRSDDLWHPVTGTYTHRQKMQRAFAAEFLAPIDSLKDYLAEDYSLDSIQGAAEYFDVSEYLVGSHLANHNLIGRRHPAVPNGRG